MYNLLLLDSSNMKTKRKATPRVSSISSLRSTNISDFPQEQDPYSIDLESERLLSNVDGVYIPLNSATSNVCSSRCGASHVCTCSGSIQHNNPKAPP